MKSIGVQTTRHTSNIGQNKNANVTSDADSACLSSASHDVRNVFQKDMRKLQQYGISHPQHLTLSFWKSVREEDYN